jgi:Glycosyltransferase family 87
MAPLSLLPFGLAVALFVGASIAAFAATVAWWLPRVVPAAGDGQRSALALAAGFYPPVAGSVFAGQVNLLVFALIGIGLAPFIVRSDGDSDHGPGRLRDVLAGGAICLAGIVKLAPLALGVPLAVSRTPRARAALAGLLLTAVASLALAALLAPQSVGGAGTLGALFAPDPFSTNQSLNGAISRLFLDGDRTVALLAGDPAPWAMTATVLFGVATLAVLVRGLGRPAADRRTSDRTLAIGLALTLVAAAAGAPKNSFWNDAPVLLAIALAASADAFGTRSERLLVGAWLAATVVQFAVDRVLADPASRGSPLWTLASDAGLVALLALWLAIAFALVQPPGPSIAKATVRPPRDGA